MFNRLMIAVLLDISNSSGNSPWWSKPEWWSLLVTAIAAGIVGWQSWETRKAAKATADSANATYGSVMFAEAQLALTREKERARLDLDVRHTRLEVEVAGEDLVHLIATVSIRNIGASRAFIRRTSGTLITKLRNEELEDNDQNPLDLPEQFIDPDRPPTLVKVYCFPTATVQAFAENLEQRILSLHFFGFVEYETLGLQWRKEFRYHWMISERGVGGLYGILDPYPTPQCQLEIGSLMDLGGLTKQTSLNIPYPAIPRTPMNKSQLRHH